MSDTTTSVRALDHGTPPERFARGWHCLGLAETFRDGKPHGIDAFGGKIVVWTDSKGEINALDGYCRHMGGDLTQGEVKGDEVACPFHDWRWGGDGRCKKIPYSRRVPLRARTAAWPAMAATSVKISCSIIERAWPPYSFGHPMPSQPSLPSWRITFL